MRATVFLFETALIKKMRPAIKRRRLMFPKATLNDSMIQKLTRKRVQFFFFNSNSKEPFCAAIDFGHLEWARPLTFRQPSFFLKLPRSGGEPGIFLICVYFLSQAAPALDHLATAPPTGSHLENLNSLQWTRWYLAERLFMPILCTLGSVCPFAAQLSKAFYW